MGEAHSRLREHCATTRWLQTASEDRIRRLAVAASNFLAVNT
jgi:hypothetical protein